ncbi:MAG: diguanylate cyclase [Desulfamplus sp.]|nr:diguanylate cyclase [Desulfamplus sp.]
MKNEKPSAAERLKRLKKSFIAQLPAQLRGIKDKFLALELSLPLKEIDAALSATDNDITRPTKKELEELHRSIHTLKGSSASFGLKDLSVEASLAEELAKKMLKGEFYPADYSDDSIESFKQSKLSDDELQSDNILSQWKILVSARIDRLGIEISRIEAEESKECSNPSLSNSIDNTPVGYIEIKQKPKECLEHVKSEDQYSLDEKGEKIHSLERLVYICEDDPFQCANLADQIRCFGFNVSAFNDLEKFKDAVADAPPDVIVMDMMHNNRQTGGAEVIIDLMTKQKISTPVVFVSAQTDLLSRLAAVRAGSSAYFVKPANPSSLCAALHALTTTEESESSRIMIVEDDTFLSEMYATILKDAGMEITILNDPLKAMPVLAEFRPDLILMDMHMPGCNGMELAKSIRQMEEYISIPIVFLSSETDIDLHFDARRMGGDEFLLKPIKPHHLISAVSVRAERMKLIRSFMIKDSMTGLYNHSAIKEYLSTHIERAIRNGSNISFAMIDIDRFKTVNDTYGHPVGDQVLVSLASLLKQRLRKSDVIGRYGGEEFAVILPDCSINKAVEILDQLRKNFAAICFRSGKSTFSSSFSCGVATLSDSYRCKDVLSNDRMERICSAADVALYAAKNGGRNRVMAAPPL